MTPMSLVTLALLTAASPSQPGAVNDIATAYPRQKSEVYSVVINGRPVDVLRNDGREGPLSYVHAQVEGVADVRVHVAEGTDNWRALSAATLSNQNREGHILSFRAELPAYVLLETDAEERLYLLLDPPPEKPTDPSHPDVTSIRDHGVQSSPKEIQTEALQSAIDAVAAHPGGGILYFPPGIYRTGTLSMRSNVTLHLAAGALIQGSSDPEDYPLDPGTSEQPDRTEDIRTRLLLFDDVQNAGLRGEGEIDCMGHILRAELRKVPNCIRVRRSHNITIEGVTLRRSAGWNTHIFHSRNVTVRNIKIFGTWSDGIDVDSSHEVTIEGVMSSSYDDAFCLKSTRFEDWADRVGDIVLRNSMLWTMKAAMKLGTETNAEVFENFLAENVTVAGGREAMTIRLYDGATVRNLVYRDIDVHTAEHSDFVILFEIGRRHGEGKVRDVNIEGLTVDAELPSHLHGLDENHTIRGVTITGFTMAGEEIRSVTEGKLDLGAHVEKVVVAQ